MSQRLTWDGKNPAPFESAWGVFAKLIAVNFARPREIGLAIQRLDLVESDRSGALDFRHSHWIDFVRFGEAIGVAPSRLKCGFLDQLGFSVPTRDWSDGIRHCPACLRMGYHCTLFDLGFIARCPWHDIPLTQPCLQCARAVMSPGLQRRRSGTRQVTGGVSDDLDQFESICGHISFRDKVCISTNAMSTAQSTLVAAKCVELLHWWNSVGLRLEDRVILLGGLAANRAKNRDESSRELCLGLVERQSGPCPWRVQNWSTPARFTKSTIQNSSPTAIQRAISDEQLWLLYRGVRRYIFSRFVRRHRKCWRVIRNLQPNDELSLSSKRVCSVCLAYATWLIVTCDGRKFEQLRAQRTMRPLEPLMASEHPFSKSPTALVAWLIAIFLSTWHRIEMLEGHAFRICRNREAMTSPSIHWITDTSTSEGKDSSFRNWWLIYPDSDHIMVLSDSRCSGRHTGPDDFLNWQLRHTVDFWAYSNESDCIFQARGNNMKSHYSYIVVGDAPYDL
jgi:hypothetical protein